MKFKQDEYQEQFIELSRKNPWLFTLLADVNNQLLTRYKYEPTITHLFRSQADHDALYAATAPDKRPKTSPHMFWQACDLRTNDMTKEMIDFVVSFCNTTYKNPNGKVSAMAHQIAGNAYHLHIQYKLG